METTQGITDGDLETAENKKTRNDVVTPAHWLILT